MGYFLTQKSALFLSVRFIGHQNSPLKVAKVLKVLKVFNFLKVVKVANPHESREGLKVANIQSRSKITVIANHKRGIITALIVITIHIGKLSVLLLDSRRVYG